MTKVDRSHAQSANHVHLYLKALGARRTYVRTSLLKELCHHLSVFLVTEAKWGLSNQFKYVGDRDVVL